MCPCRSIISTGSCGIEKRTEEQDSARDILTRVSESVRDILKRARKVALLLHYRVKKAFILLFVFICLLGSAQAQTWVSSQPASQRPSQKSNEPQRIWPLPWALPCVTDLLLANAFLHSLLLDLASLGTHSTSSRYPLADADDHHRAPHCQRHEHTAECQSACIELEQSRADKARIEQRRH